MHALLRETNLIDQKSNLLESYGVEHASDLDCNELSDLINYLVNIKQGTDSKKRQLRSDILSQLQRMGIYADNKDWSKVNRYLLDSRIAGKLLYQMSEQELKSLSIKLRSIEHKHQLKKAEIERLKMNN